MSKPVRALPPGPSLPDWAQRGLEGPTIEVLGEDDPDEAIEAPPLLEEGDKNLPKWARKGLEK